MTPEPWVDATRIAEHLGLSRKFILDLTRKNKLPAHPVDPTADKKTWRYKLSEVDATIGGGLARPAQQELAETSTLINNRHGSPKGQRG